MFYGHIISDNDYKDLQHLWKLVFYHMVRATLKESFQLVKKFLKKNLKRIKLSWHFVYDMLDCSDSQLHTFNISKSNMHIKLPICILTRHSQFETTERREKGTTQIIKMKCKSHMEELEVLKWQNLSLLRSIDALK